MTDGCYRESKQVSAAADRPTLWHCETHCRIAMPMGTLTPAMIQLHCVDISGVALGGGSGTPAQSKATCGNRPDPMTFFWGGESSVA